MLALPSTPPEATGETFNLAFPPSRCPACSASIKWYQNIPLVSWLALRGKCASCGVAISKRYPAVELICGLLAWLCAVQFGVSIWMVAALGLSLTLVALTLIDFDTFLLPDNITLPLTWAGVLLALLAVSPVSLEEAVIGAMVGYLSLWSLYWLFKLLTGREGMGYGDFKLTAALGAWLGWQALPMVLLISALVGLVVGVPLTKFAKGKTEHGIPFGPYLAIAGIICLLFGNSIAPYLLAI